MPNRANTNLQVVSNEQASQATTRALPRLRDYRFTLLSALHQSLEIGTILQTFYEAMGKWVNAASMVYECAQLDKTLAFGAPATHSACYHLTHGQSQLGQLKFTRAKRFSEKELQFTESLLGLLVPHLRNGLLYETALRNSLQDGLTGLGNRAALNQCLEREIALSHRKQQPLSMIVADIDHFKTLNDEHGHVEGDRALKEVATAIKDSLRSTDQAFRFGGEEFIVVLDNTELSDALMVAERIRLTVATDCWQRNRAVTVSIGVSTLKLDDTCISFLNRTDQALYQAKNTGRNRCVGS